MKEPIPLPKVGDVIWAYGEPNTPFHPGKVISVSTERIVTVQFIFEKKGSILDYGKPNNLT